MQRPFVEFRDASSAYQEQTLDVIVTGVNTHFAAGTTAASFGPGISINQVTVTSATVATVHLTVSLAAIPGPRHRDDDDGPRKRERDRRFAVLAKETPTITWPTPADIVPPPAALEVRAPAIEARDVLQSRALAERPELRAAEARVQAREAAVVSPAASPCPTCG